MDEMMSLGRGPTSITAQCRVRAEMSFDRAAIKPAG